MTRNQKILSLIDRNGFGVEIGPSFSPIAPKRDGFKVHVIDHATREELVAKYTPHGVPVELIEDVDFVWRGQPYSELTGRPNFYDWVIASHVVEHSPDLVGFLSSCDSLLKDGGVLAVVVPDKRVCFDRFRPITGLARVIDAHLAGNLTHSPGTAAECVMNAVRRRDRIAWDEGFSGRYAFCHSSDEAASAMRSARSAESYVDFHNWCFTPHAFRLLVADLFTLGFTRLREMAFMPTVGCEFFVALSRRGPGPGLSRLEMLRAIDAELAATDAPRIGARIGGWLRAAAGRLRGLRSR